jgi:cell division protease FtsH
MAKKKISIQFGYVVLSILGVLLVHEIIVSAKTVATIPYSQFRQLLDSGKVTEVSVGATEVRGSLKEPLPSGQKEFVSARVDEPVSENLEKKGVKFSRMIENHILQDLLAWVLPSLLFLGVGFFLMKRMQGGGAGGGFLTVGKSKARIYAETDIGVRFKDVAGVDEAKEELKEIVDYLKNPASYGRLGGRMPKGVLLVGPPGTGKTLLAKAVAGEASVPFFSISGSEFVEMFVGVGAARVRDLFQQARGKAPCIVFIDELDALGRARSSMGGIGGGNDEKEQTLNQLLVELDGFESGTGLVLLGATNRPEILDTALLRAGRFDRQVLVDRPDKSGREAILKVHILKVVMAEGVDLSEVASLTSGFTGADLANLVNEAALAATRRSAVAVDKEDFTMAIERIIAGLEKKSRVLSPKEKEIVAFHEMGHALVGSSLPGSGVVHKVSIIPHGIGALGYTIQRPTEDRFLMTREELTNRLCVLMGGRVAEHLQFGHLSTGASDDLSRATDIARGMATRYGMVPSLGHATYDKEPSGFLGHGSNHAKDYSDHTAAAIDEAIRQILDQAFKRTEAILSANRALLEEGARSLLVKETLVEADLQDLIRRLQPPAEMIALPLGAGVLS